MATILVVDDEPDLRVIVRTFLEREGHSVVEADSGEAALAMLARKDPDLVLLDLRMPGIDGWQVLDELGVERLEALPVVILSANVDGSSARRAEELGCRGYLSKPFTRVELAALVAEAIES